MKKTQKILTIFLTILTISSIDDGKTEADIIKESQICGEHRFDLEGCYETSNCVFIEWFIENLKTEISFCFSYSEIMKYFIIDPEDYLLKNDIKNHSTIGKSNFCDVIDENDSFLGIDGNILLCKVNPSD